MVHNAPLNYKIDSRVSCLKNLFFLVNKHYGIDKIEGVYSIRNIARSLSKKTKIPLKRKATKTRSRRYILAQLQRDNYIIGSRGVVPKGCTYGNAVL